MRTECTIYHGKRKLQKKLVSGICQIRADELKDLADELKALPCRHFPMDVECPDCIGQQARRSQSMPEYRRATGFLGRVYMDRIGPTSRSLYGFTSTIIMVDEYSIENMKSGQELCPVVEALLYLAETEEVNGERSQIRCIRGDCEFFSNDLAEMANQRRIRLKTQHRTHTKKGLERR